MTPSDDLRHDRALPVEDPLAPALRGALTRAADAVHPRPDGLSRIQARLKNERPGTGRRWGTGRGPGQPRGAVLLAAASVVVAVTGVSALVTLPSSPNNPAVRPSVSPASGTPTPSPTLQAAALPVYYPGGPGQSSGLFREFHPVPAGQAVEDSAQRVQQAVTQAMSQRPDDPDYVVPWPAGANARTTFTGSLITITLNQAAAGGSAIAGPGGDALAVQQLIWTATAAAAQPAQPAQPGVTSGPAQVLIRADGPTPTRWGSIDLTHAFARGGPPGTGDPRAPVWIDSLGQDDTVPAGPLTVQGEGAGPLPLHWSLIRDGRAAGSGTVQVVDTTRGPLGARVRGGWTFSADVSAPGQYTLMVTQDGATDTKDFVVSQASGP